MKREIKFRAWDGERLTYPIDNIESGDIIKRYETVMQYTGLPDKNGKEIYERDIVQHSTGEICEIIFIEGSFCYRYKEGEIRKMSKYSAPYCRVIGDVYQDSYLLE